MPSLQRNRTPSDLVVHADCPVHRHGEDPGCICPTRRQNEQDAKGGGAIPVKDPRIEAEFTRPVGDPTYSAGRLDRIVWFDDDVACRGMDVNIWFPVGTGPDAKAQERFAKSICGSCPVEDSCATAAIRRGEQWGVFGGLNPDERRQHRALMSGARAA